MENSPEISQSSPHGFCMDTSETWNVYTGHANRKPWVRAGTHSNAQPWVRESTQKLQSLSRREQSTGTYKTLTETAIHWMKSWIFVRLIQPWVRESIETAILEQERTIHCGLQNLEWDMDICENYLTIYIYIYIYICEWNFSQPRRCGQNHSHDSECFGDLLPANCNLPKIYQNLSTEPLLSGFPHM